MNYNSYHIIMLESWRLNIQLNLNEPFCTGFLKYYNGKYTVEMIYNER